MCSKLLLVGTITRYHLFSVSIHQNLYEEFRLTHFIKKMKFHYKIFLVDKEKKMPNRHSYTEEMVITQSHVNLTVLTPFDGC